MGVNRIYSFIDLIRIYGDIRLKEIWLKTEDTAKLLTHTRQGAINHPAYQCLCPIHILLYPLYTRWQRAKCPLAGIWRC